MDELNHRRICFCTDDRIPGDLLDQGSIDYMVREAIAHGVEPILAIRMATLNPAEWFGLHDRGAVAPGRLADLIDQRLLLGSGFLILALSAWLMSGADQYTAWWTLAGWLVINRIGIGIMGPSLNLSGIQTLPPQFLQQGAGAMNFIRQLGGAFGVNLLSVALDFRLNFHKDVLMATQTYGHSDTLSLLAELRRHLSAAGLSFWDQQLVAYGAVARIVYQQAYLLAFQDSFLILVVVLLAALVVLAFLGKK